MFLQPPSWDVHPLSARYHQSRRKSKKRSPLHCEVPQSPLFSTTLTTAKPLDCATLASVVTQPNRAFRILGYSEEMFYENRATILYTGSNVEVTPELAKRLVAIRLADTGVPEKDRKVKVEGLLKPHLE